MVSGVIIDPDEGIFVDFKDEVMMNFFTDGVVDLRGIVSDRSAIAISWVFSIVEELVKHCDGRIIQCGATTYATGFREIHVMVDQSTEPVTLPAITPAEHFSVIVHPVASGLPYGAYLLESREAFHGNKMIGITGISTDSQPNGIDYCIRIVEELKRNENAAEVVSSGWIYGQNQYALDVVLTHPNIKFSDLLPQRSRYWNFHSQCKLLRYPLVVRDSNFQNGSSM